MKFHSVSLLLLLILSCGGVKDLAASFTGSKIQHMIAQEDSQGDQGGDDSSSDGDEEEECEDDDHECGA